tara:strand:- start:568 stop:819 length:252 start_codon:yes stop_codon:yes gene_type:complete
MKYANKKAKKIIERIKKRWNEGDEDPLKRVENMARKRLTKLSRGGKVERSHKKRVGNIVNKDVEKRYNVANKTLERIEGKRKK